MRKENLCIFLEISVRPGPLRPWRTIGNSGRPRTTQGNAAISESLTLSDPVDSGPAVVSGWRRSVPVTGLVVWLVMALAMIWRYSPDPWLAEPPDPDSLLRLVQVRDLLNGQAWGDLVQARLGGEAGLAMHWSRLVDAPIAAMILTGGETFAKFAWPLALFLAFILAALGAARRLGGSAAVLPAAVVAALNIDIITHFIPGRFDHHNVQLVLLLSLVTALLRMGENRLSAAVAGLVVALMLAVGMEALPFAAAAGAILTLTWAFDSADGAHRDGAEEPAGVLRKTDCLAHFALTFALALLVLYPITVPVGGADFCDALSAVYLTTGIVGGAGTACVAVMARRAAVTTRLCALAVVGLGVAATVVLLFPACLAGPMGNVSAELKAEWLSTVAEAQPLWAFAAVFPEVAFATFAAPLLATIFACRRALSGSEGEVRKRWIAMAGFLLVALLFSVYQYRGSPFLNALSIPVLAVWIAEWRRYAEEKIKDSGRAIAILLIWLSGLQVSYLSLAGMVASAAALVSPAPVTGTSAQRPAIPLADADATAAERECTGPPSTAALASLPNGRVFAPLFYGPTVLAISGHSALAGPYHRAQGPILDTVRAGAGSDAAARAVVQKYGIDYVLICPTSKEALLLYQEQPSGFFARLMRGRHPAWLEPVATGESYLQIYRAMPETGGN